MIPVPAEIKAIIEKQNLTAEEVEQLKEWFKAGGWQWLDDQTLAIDELPLAFYPRRYKHNARLRFYISPGEFGLVTP